MKTKAEIREVRDNIKILMSKPCSCKLQPCQHEACGQILQDMEKAVELLSWTLGENDRFDRYAGRPSVSDRDERMNLTTAEIEVIGQIAGKAILEAIAPMQRSLQELADRVTKLEQGAERRAEYEHEQSERQ